MSTVVDLAAVKSRHPLGDLVEASGVQLRGRGRVRQGVCPFHEEAKGSFTVYGDSERWYCFGCGAGGDVLDFVQRMDAIGLPEAIGRLEDGSRPTPGTAIQSEPACKPRRSNVAVVPQRHPALLAAAVRFYARQLRQSPEARGYLASRGIGSDTAIRLGLGYAPGHGFREALESGGFTREDLRDSGLFTDRGERFARMVVVPDMAHGRVRWLAGRAVDPDRSPRFQALPGPKPVLGRGRLSVTPSWVVLTEGLFDWLVLAQWGLPACAALGTQGTERIAESLRGCPRVLLAFDRDDAGRSAAELLEELLGRRAVVVTLPDGVTDVADLATYPHGRAVFQRLLARAARTVA